MKSLIVLSTTVEKYKDAERLAQVLFERKLIACAHISNQITSIYRWEGELVQSTEFILNVKTTPELFKKISKIIIQEHPYHLPEIIAIETHQVEEKYCNWVHMEVQHD